MVNSLQLELSKIDIEILRDDVGEKNTDTIKKLVTSFVDRYQEILFEAKKYDKVVLEVELLKAS